MTAQYPDAIEHVLAAGRGIGAIIDAEIVAVDPRSGSVAEFQKLQSRPRKALTASNIADCPIRVHAFDLLSLQGESLLPVRRAGRAHAARVACSRP